MTISYSGAIKYRISSSTTATTASDLWLPASSWTTGTYTPWPPIPAPSRTRTPPSGFNRFVNASDLLEEFIGFLGKEGIRQGEVMGLPVELFIKWLIIKACEHDGEEPNVTLALPAPKQQPRCLGCQRFLPAAVAVSMHDARCAGFYFTRQRRGRLGI